jgi:ferredoxin-NADP reductase
VGLYAGQASADSPYDGNGRIAANIFLVGGTNRTANRYRISVKREPQGKASRILHEQIQVGDVIDARKPAGDFVLLETDQNNKNIANDHRTVVLLSTGVDVTPLLSMLDHLVALNGDAKADTGKQYALNHNPQIVWIHGARDDAHHAFRYDSNGRIDANLVQELVPDLLHANFDFRGPWAFMANVTEGLEQLGVDPQYIHFPSILV